jgi:hypothetical protein
MQNPSRRIGSWLALASTLIAVAAVAPARAQLPDRQTTTWHVRSPNCTIVMAWRLDPTALTASSLDDVASIHCATYPLDQIRAEMTLTDENEQYIVNRDFLYPGTIPPEGPATLEVSETPVKRHAYIAHLSVYFPGTFTNARPAQCALAVGSSVTCELDQRIVSLTKRAALAGSPTPTPADTGFGPACGISVTVTKAEPAGLDVHLHQYDSYCLGSGAMSIYADRQEVTQLAHTAFSTSPPSPDADLLLPLALPGHVYTVTVYETFFQPVSSSSACRTFFSAFGGGLECEATVNVVAAN